MDGTFRDCNFPGRKHRISHYASRRHSTQPITSFRSQRQDGASPITPSSQSGHNVSHQRSRSDQFQEGNSIKRGSDNTSDARAKKQKIVDQANRIKESSINMNPLPTITSSDLIVIDIFEENPENFNENTETYLNTSDVRAKKQMIVGQANGIRESSNNINALPSTSSSYLIDIDNTQNTRNSNKNAETHLPSKSNSGLNRSANEAVHADNTSSNSTPSTSYVHPLTKVSDKNSARGENPVKRHSIANKKDAILSNEKKLIHTKMLLNDSAMQIKLLLLEFNKMIKRSAKIFYILDVNESSNICDTVFCIENANIRYLYKAKYYSQEYRTYRKINFRMLGSAEFNLDSMYRAFRDSGLIDRVIICSNLELDKQSLGKHNIRVLDNTRRGTRSIQVFEGSELLKKMREKHSTIYKLAEYLHECMRVGKQVKLSGVMEKYHVMLVKECVIKIHKINDDKQIARFHRRFIESADDQLKPVIAQLRRYLKNLNHGKLMNEDLYVKRNFGEGTYSIIDQTAESDESIKSFFRKLEFMACEENVDSRIRQDVGETFELIQSEFHVKEINNELFERLRRDSDQADLFPALKRKILGCDLLNFQRNKNEMNIKLEFELVALRSLKALLSENRNSTIVVKSDNPSLCALKLQQLIESTLSTEYPEGRYFFLDVSELLGATNHIPTVFAASSKHLLIVQADGVLFKNEQEKNCLRDTRQLISNAQNRTNKMVIIRNINDPPIDLNINVTEHDEIFNNKADLTKVSQDKLRETHCQYYGNKVTLKELIFEHDDLTDLLGSPQCVSELVKGKLIIQNSSSKLDIFQSTDTLPRRLKRHVTLNLTALKEDNNDIFFLSGLENKSKSNRIHYFSSTDLADLNFEQFASKNRNVNVHLLKCESNRGIKQLTWLRSSRSISSLMKYVVEMGEALRKPEPISNVLARRVMILCGEPGSGKSHYLFEMARQLEISSPSSEDWVVQINLNNSLIEQYAGSPLSSPADAVDLLTKILGYSELHRRLFCLSAAGKLKMKLSVFVDRLEELSEKNVLKISEILQFLRETNLRRIYVATRPNFKDVFERALDDFAYNLDPLTRNEQESLLINTWFSLSNQTATQEDLKKFAGEVFKSSDVFDIIHQPLYLHIFSMVCWKNGQNVPQIRGIYDIFTQYFDKILNNLERSRRDIFCLKRLFSSEVIRNLNLREVQLSEDFNKLNHSSLAEYGAAIYLASLSLQEQISVFNNIEDFATRASIVFIETFICNCKVPYEMYIERLGDNRLVEQLFIRHIWDHANELQRLQYLRTALLNSESLFKTFLDKFNDTAVNQILEHGEFRHPEYATSPLVEFINKEKLVLEAARMDKLKLACELTLRGADVRELPIDFVERTAVHVASTLTELKSKQLHPYWSIIEKLLKLAPQASAHLDVEKQLPPLLAYFFAHGRLEVITKILTSLDDSKKRNLLHTRVDKRTPLEIVNSSASMADEERQEISKFLLSEHQYSEEKVFSVMTAAAKCGHVHCFEYFAGTSSERLSRFFKSALRTNQLDVLGFLLNNSNWTVDLSCAGNQPLHTAVKEEASIKTLKFLLSRSGVNNQNSKGETALSVAIQAGIDLRTIKFLVNEKADPNSRDNRGLSPWCYALLAEWCRYSPERQRDLIHFLKRTTNQLALRLPGNNNFELDRWNDEIILKSQYLLEPSKFNFNCLHFALEKDNLVLFNFLLLHGADPNPLDSQNRSALHIAIGMDNSNNIVEKVRQLLRYGAIFNGVDNMGRTPLDLLHSRNISTDDEGEASKLLRQTTDIFDSIELLKEEASVRDSKAAKSTMLYWLLHCRDSHKRTLLHRAAEQAQLPLNDLKNLLEFGELYGRDLRAWLDARDENDDTAAHLAACFGNHGMLQELARKGTCLELQNLNGEIPLDLTHELRTSALLKMSRNLFAKVRQGTLETSLLMSTKYYCANIRDKNGCTLLHAAASTQNLIAYSLLPKWEASVIDSTDNEGRTPLHYAVDADNLEATKLLIKAGASLDMRDKCGKQPADLGNQSNRSAELVCTINEMLECCWRDELDVYALDTRVDTLIREFDLEPCIVVNANDSGKNSFVHYAARNHDPELMKALLKHGAVYNARNSLKETPMIHAVGEVKELLRAVDDFFSCPKVAAWEDKKDAVDLEIIIQCRTVGGCTLLHAALEAGKVEEAEWLMDKGADVNVTNNVGALARKLAEGFQLIVENPIVN